MKQVFEDATEALDFMVGESTKLREMHLAQLRTSEFAGRVLKQKGALVHGTDGRFGGSSEDFGSGRRGIRYIRGTEPVRIRENEYVTLSHGLSTHRSDEHMHLCLQETDDIGYLGREEQRTLATFVGANVLIPGAGTLEFTHIEAIRKLVDDIDVSLEGFVPVVRRGPDLPRVVSHGATLPANEVINLRSLTNIPFELLDRR